MELLLLILGVLWLAMSAALAWAASVRARFWPGWFFLSLALSPLFAVLLLIAVGPLTDAERARSQFRGPGWFFLSLALPTLFAVLVSA